MRQLSKRQVAPIHLGGLKRQERDWTNGEISQAPSRSALQLGLFYKIYRKSTQYNAHAPSEALSSRILWLCCFLSALNSLIF